MTELPKKDFQTPGNSHGQAATTRFGDLLADPALAPDLLKQLSQDDDPEVRRQVTCNPNTPLECLLKLAEDFPEEFLNNPALMLYNMLQPHFFQDFSQRTWLSLLRCEKFPLYWLQWLTKTERSRWNYYSLYDELIQSAYLHCAWDDTSPYASLLDLPTRWRKTMARLERTPEEMLVQFASSPFFEARRDTATNPSTPAETLSKLAAGYEKAVTREVARNPSAPVELLLQLQNDRDAVVRWNVLHHPRFPLKPLVQLAFKGDEIARRAVTRRADVPVEVLRSLVSDSNQEVRLAIARHPSTPITTLVKLLADSYFKVRRQVARHPAISVEILRQMADDSDEEVRRAVAIHPSTPIDILEHLASDRDATVRKAVAGNSQTPVNVLEKLASDPDAQVVLVLAHNPHTPADALARCASAPSALVRRAVIRNPRTPLDTLIQCALDDDLLVRLEVAQNKRTPKHTLSQLILNTPQQMQITVTQNRNYYYSHAYRQKVSETTLPMGRAIAANPQASPELLAQLAQRTDEQLQVNLATNPSTPPDILARMADHPEGWLRVSVAYNPAIPPDILSRLLSDPDKQVREQARLRASVLAQASVQEKQPLKQEHAPQKPDKLILKVLHRSPAPAKQLLNSEQVIYLSPLGSAETNHTYMSYPPDLSAPDLPLSWIYFFARSMAWFNRYQMAIHPATPLELLERLTHDGNRYVRMAARSWLEKRAHQ